MVLEHLLLDHTNTGFNGGNSSVTGPITPWFGGAGGVVHQDGSGGTTLVV